MKILAKILFYLSIGLMIFSWSIQALGMSKGYEVVGIALFAHLTIIGIGLAFPVWANITFVVTCLYFSENNNYRKATVLSIVTVLLMIVGCVVAVITDGIAWGAVVWLYSGVLLLISIIYQKNLIQKTSVVLLLCLMVITTISLELFSRNSKKYVSSDMSEQAVGMLFNGMKYQYNPENVVIPPLNEVKQNDDNRLNIGDPRENSHFDLSILQSKLIEIDTKSVIYKADSVVKGFCEIDAEKTLPIQLPLIYLQDQFKWKLYSFVHKKNGQFAVGVKSEQKPDFIYKIDSKSPIEKNILIEDVKNQQIVYQQNIIPFYDFKNHRCKYEPARYKKELSAQFLKENIQFNVRKTHFKFDDTVLKNETLVRGCNWQALPQKNVYAWDGKRIDFQLFALHYPLNFCSPNYLAVAYIPQGFFYDELANEIHVSIFKRDDLTPLNHGQLYFFDQSLSEFVKHYMQGKLPIQSIQIGVDQKNQPFYTMRFKNSMVIQGKVFNPNQGDEYTNTDY